MEETVDLVVKVEVTQLAKDQFSPYLEVKYEVNPTISDVFGGSFPKGYGVLKVPYDTGINKFFIGQKLSLWFRNETA